MRANNDIGKNPVDRYFEISKRNSRLSTEILAGASTFLSLSYIIFVNPAILAEAGMDINVVLFATVVVSGLSCMVMGLYARLPFALAPGLEMNGFVAFVMVGVMGLSWQQCLGAVFWSGVLCLVFSIAPIRFRIVEAVPTALQSNLAVSVGVFVVTIGLQLSGIIQFEGGRLVSFGPTGSSEAISLYIGFFICLFLDWSWLRGGEGSPNIRGGSLVPGCFLIAIIVTTIYCRTNGITQETPVKLSLSMLDAISEVDYFSFFTEIRLWPSFLVLFMIDFYGSIGKFIGLTSATNLRDPRKGVTRIEQAMQVDAIGTMGGAALGTTSIITYVESAVGIAAGARTGICAVVCGSLMLSCLLLTPLIGLVPVVATSGVLAYVGILLLPRDQARLNSYARYDVTIGVAMAVISFLTMSLDKAMVFGFGAYALRQVISKEQKVDWYLMGSFILLLSSVILQYVIK